MRIYWGFFTPQPTGEAVTRQALSGAISRLTKTNFLPRVTPLGVVAVLLLLCVAGWTLKTGLLITIPGGDGETQHLPSRALAGEMYRAGHLPLWNRFESSGIPLAALVQPGSFYPPNIFLYTLLPYKLAFNLSLAMHFLLLAYFMRRYLQALRLSANAVTFGTIAWSLSGFLLMHSSAVPIFNAVVWIPACFYCIEKWIQTQRWRYPAYAGVCLALSLLAGWAQILALCALYLCLYGALSWREINHRKKCLLGFGLAFVIAALVVMPQVVLTMGFKPYTSLRSLDWHLFASASYPPQLLLTLLFPGFFYSFAGGSLFKPMLWWGPPDSAIMTIYVGILPLYLALAALPRWRSSRTVRFFSLLAVLAAWMAFGAYTPLGSLLYRLPVFQFFHDHWVNFVFVSFALAVLAAHGIDNLGFPELSRRAAVAWRAATCVIPLALAALF